MNIELFHYFKNIGPQAFQGVAIVNKTSQYLSKNYLIHFSSTWKIEPSLQTNPSNMVSRILSFFIMEIVKQLFQLDNVNLLSIIMPFCFGVSV